ncbi:MAG: ABC transporter permease [Lachnospiraceae bacterium]|nr:ABC transporter permease [Lachnospiraceae bacterium]
MMNYIKSEWYRITHTKDIYVLTAILAGLTLLVNIVLFLAGKADKSFPYATVSFSLSNLACGLTLLFFVGAVVVSVLFAQDRKKGILKNAVAYGISREKLFIGKSIVCAVVSVCSLVVVLVVYIGSAVLLLEQGVVPDAVPSLLKGIACMLIMAVAFEVLLIAAYNFYEKEILTYLLWYVIMAAIPRLSAIIGLKFDVVGKIAAWMPYNYLSNEVIVNMSGWECLWDTPQGVAKCLISGVIALVVFGAMGLKISKKMEV